MLSFPELPPQTYHIFIPPFPTRCCRCKYLGELALRSMFEAYRTVDFPKQHVLVGRLRSHVTYGLSFLWYLSCLVIMLNDRCLSGQSVRLARTVLRVTVQD